MKILKITIFYVLFSNICGYNFFDSKKKKKNAKKIFDNSIRTDIIYFVVKTSKYG